MDPKKPGRALSDHISLSVSLALTPSPPLFATRSILNFPVFEKTINHHPHLSLALSFPVSLPQNVVISHHATNEQGPGSKHSSHSIQSRRVCPSDRSPVLILFFFSTVSPFSVGVAPVRRDAPCPGYVRFQPPRVRTHWPYTRCEAVPGRVHQIYSETSRPQA